MKRTPLPPLLALLAVAALALAGCGGSDSSSTAPAQSTSADAGTATTATSGSSTSGDVVVQMQSISFQPKALTARVGQRITWVNDDNVLHNVVSTSGESVRSELFSKGKSFSFTPTRAGTISYVCTIHPGMDGTITVTQ
ncbi:MAG TPA: plastocyanin/azurin family copper-binding protein [Conexibacter sp.]|jgi:plastocyanin